VSKHTSVTLINLPILDEAAQTLRLRGRYAVELTEAALAELTAIAAPQVVATQRSIRMGLEEIRVQCREEDCRVSGQVTVKAPIRATLLPLVVFGPDGSPGSIRLVHFSVQIRAGILARSALAALGIEERLRAAMLQPNAAFGQALCQQLAPRGALVTGVGIRLKSGAVRIALEGRAI
jgi:hypothetical protein